MPTIKASRNAIIQVVHGLQHLDPTDTSLSITWVHGTARNVKLATGLLAEWKAKSEDVNSEAYRKYEALAEQVAADCLDAIKEEYKEVIADRAALIDAANAWLAEEIEYEIYAWPLEAVPASIDRQFLIALTDWIRD